MASSISMLGSRVTTIAYPMLVLYLTGSPLVAGLVGCAATAPSVLVYIPAGALVDRWDPRRAMLVSESGRGVAITTVAVVVALGRPSIILLALLAVIEESLEVFSMLAERRYVRSLVDPGQVPSALVRSEARTHLVVLIGRPLGGLLFGLSRILPFALDVFSFVYIAGVLLRNKEKRSGFLKLSIQPRAGFRPRSLYCRDSDTACLPGTKLLTMMTRGIGTGSRQLVHDIWDGIKHMRADSFARVVVPLAACTTLIAQALIVIFLAEAHANHIAPLVLSLVLAAPGVGGVAGSLAGKRLHSFPGFPWLQIQMWAWVAVLTPFVIFGDGYSIWIMSVAMLVSGFTGALGNIAINVRLTSRSSETVLARLMSIYTLMVFGAFSAGSALGGFLAEWARGQSGIFVLLAIVVVLALVSTAMWPEARSGKYPVTPVQCALFVLVTIAFRPSEAVCLIHEAVRSPLTSRHPGQREDQLPRERVQLRPGKAGERGAQQDRPVQRDPDGGCVGDRVRAGRRAGRGAFLDRLHQQRERLGAERQDRAPVGAEPDRRAVLLRVRPVRDEQHAVARRVLQAEGQIGLAPRDEAVHRVRA